MSDDKTPEIEIAETEGFPADLVERIEADETPRAKRKTSTVAHSKEPTQDSADPAASAKPAVVPAAPNAAVSGAAVDPITYSRAVPAGKTGPRRSLTVYHIQRRLYEHGYKDAWSESAYGKLTLKSVSEWQESRGETVTGILTREQFLDLFRGDQNVDASIDTIGDHPLD